MFLGLEHFHLQMQTLLRDLKPDNVVLICLAQVVKQLGRHLHLALYHLVVE